MAAAQGALRRRRPARARRHLDRLRRLALQRAPLEHRAAAAPDASSRSSPRRTWRPSATRCWASSARDRRRGGGLPLPADPDAVRGRARQLLPDRGRPADAGRHRAELRQGARRARARAGRARPPRRGPRADRHHAPAHRPPRAGRHPRPPLGRRGLRARPARARDRALRRGGRARRRARRGADAAPRHPARRRHRAALGLALVPRLGRLERRSPARSPTARTLEFAGRTLEVLHRPGHSPSDTLFHDRERGIAARRRPPDRATSPPTR